MNFGEIFVTLAGLAGKHTRWLLAAALYPVAIAAASAEVLELDPQVLQAESERIERIADAVQATIAVFGPRAEGGGSGVIISADGFALTNYHVTHPCGDYMRCGLPDGQLYDAVIVGLDPVGDVALIKLLGRDDFPTATLGDSDLLRAGDACFVAGNPFVLATDFQPTVTYGMISGVHRYQPPAGTLLEYADCIQTDASINPGNSGGPLFNSRGQLIGVNGRCSFEKRGRVNVGVGYAISINQIKKFLGCLHSGRIVDHATFGFTASDDDGRVVVSNILRSSDAFRRGIRYGDEIVSVAGRTIDTANALKNLLGTYPKGWRIPITIRRDGVETQTQVRLAGVHPGDTLFELVERTLAEPNEGEPKRPKGHDQPGRRLAPQDETPEMPLLVKERLEKRWGFANYYFNRQHLDRILAVVRSTYPEGVAAESWKIRGTVEREGSFEIEIGQESVLATLPSGRWSVGEQSAYTSQHVVPNGSGGLLLALKMWHRLARRAAEDSSVSYGDLVYEGTAPLLELEPLYDTVVGVHKNLETRYYFDTTTSRLVAMEMFPDLGVDPCEVYFSYDDADPTQLIEFRVVFGDRVVGTFQVEELSFE